MSKARGSVRRAPVGRWGEREEGILAVAAKLFAQGGYDSVSMATVAKAAGLSEGTLYNYFRDRRDLLIRVSLVGYEQRIAETERAIEAAPSLRAGLEVLVAMQIHVVIDQKEVYRMWLREVRSTEAYDASESRGLNRRFTNLFVRLLERWNVDVEAKTGLSPAVMRDIVFGGTEHVAFTAIVQRREKSLDVAETAARLTDGFMRAFCLV